MAWLQEWSHEVSSPGRWTIYVGPYCGNPDQKWVGETGEYISVLVYIVGPRVLRE